jgi:hypothetical protein
MQNRSDDQVYCEKEISLTIAPLQKKPSGDSPVLSALKENEQSRGEMIMTFTTRFLGMAALGLTLLTAGSGAAFADHPHYLHALSDLRAARAHINRLSSQRIDRDESHAISQIDHAIKEIKKASIDDHKNLNDHPPIDAGLDRTGRLHRAIQLLDSAKNDCAQEEDNGTAVGLQGRVLTHIDKAHRDVEKALHGK